jgi:UDP-N-acetylmuramoyl-L-alanyl-D-glutamate--2,6-diaminopimelate ligase
VAELTLQGLLEAGFVERIDGDASVCVHGIRHDSRAVEPGDLFAAIPGITRHGAEFAPDAVARGAVAVLSDRPVEAGVPVALTDDVLRALADIARRLYDDPTAGLAVVGVTGTNGKTTVSYLIESVIARAGHAPAVIGTVSFRGPGGVRAATHTTPMADDMMRLSRWAAETGATHLVLEVSSHALAMRRADGVRFEVAAFTNISQDHLDYHGSFDNYAAAKSRLFLELSPGTSVINVDDELGASLARRVRGRVLRCSREGSPDAELRVIESSVDATGTRARVATPDGEAELRSPLIGDHNLENLLVTLGCGLALSIPLPTVLQALAEAKGAPGRLERVEHDELVVLVDYAHTPDAVERVLSAVRPVTRGRLIAVFGCGGDRDRGKRPRMGQAAVRGADLAIVTDDNPRTEPPEKILADVVAGIARLGATELEASALSHAERGYHVCPGRREAIRRAIRAARPDDTVLLLGKGHEDYQIVGTRREHFDDREEAQRALEERV